MFATLITPIGVQVTCGKVDTNPAWCKLAEYLLQCYRYLELNPVRAGMVTLPENYTWSSYAINGLGKESLLITPNAQYLNLGKTNKERQTAYRELLRCHLDTATLRVIRDAVSKDWHWEMIGLKPK